MRKPYKDGLLFLCAIIFVSLANYLFGHEIIMVTFVTIWFWKWLKEAR